MIRMRIAIAMVGAALGAGCASSGSQPAVGERTVAVSNGQMLQATVAPSAAREFDAPATQVWTALRTAYQGLNIELTVADPSLHRMGTTNFHVSGRFNGEELTAYADCGNGPTGPRANTSRVYFSVITTVNAVDATHTKLMTDVKPVAVDMSGTTNARLDCGTTGHLETELYDRVTAALSGSKG